MTATRPLALRVFAIVSITVFAPMAIGCSNGGDAGPAVSTTTAPATTEQPTSPVVTRVIDGASDGAVTGSDAPNADAPSTTNAASTTTIATVPDTGVPGLESADRFCQAWSEFAGSFQALALASSFAADPLTARRAELAASPVIVAATSAIDESLPAELEGERAALVDELIAPMRRRAERNLAALRDDAAFGITAEQETALATAWLQALAVAGTDDADIDVAVSGELSAVLDGVAAAIAEDVPPISSDPSLITDAMIPETEAYLAANCPDRGTLAGNDVIDG